MHCTPTAHALHKLNDFTFRAHVRECREWDLRDEPDPDDYALLIGECCDCGSTLAMRVGR